MAKKFICNGEKYEVGGPNEDTIGLPVSFSSLPPTIEVEGHTLLLKTSFHVSLVCIGKIAQKNNLTDPDIVNKMVLDFCKFTQRIAVDLKEYRDEFKLATEAERRAVIVMCNISNLDKFFDFINQKYGLKLEYPPTHVTLYTLQPNMGIFLTDSEDMRKLTKPTKNPGLVLTK
jgi:hypothetical protein